MDRTFWSFWQSTTCHPRLWCLLRLKHTTWFTGSVTIIHSLNFNGNWIFYEDRNLAVRCWFFVFYKLGRRTFWRFFVIFKHSIQSLPLLNKESLDTRVLIWLKNLSAPEWLRVHFTNRLWVQTVSNSKQCGTQNVGLNSNDSSIITDSSNSNHQVLFSKMIGHELVFDDSSERSSAWLIQQMNRSNRQCVLRFSSLESKHSKL